jgi:microcystin-dependent protein
MNPSTRGSETGASDVQRAGRWRSALALSAIAMLFAVSPARAQMGFIGQVKLFAGNFAPVSWHDCDGSLMPISQYTALFSLLGTTYGGDGQTTFALPDLRGRAVLHVGQGPGLSNYQLGQTGGVETVTLTAAQLPVHSHSIPATTSLGSSGTATGLVPASSPDDIGSYSTTSNATMNSAALQAAGGNQPHSNIKPYLAVRYIICLEGIYPPRP